MTTEHDNHRNLKRIAQLERKVAMLAGLVFELIERLPARSAKPLVLDKQARAALQEAMLPVNVPPPE